MREILFRGKRVLDGEWFEGSLVRFPDGDCYICVGGVNSCIMEKYAVCEKTIGQYTGLTDKNGVRIFEGDIVKFIHCEDLGQIVWDNDCAMFDIENKAAEHTIPNFEWVCGDDLEIIGNVHDNTELIEG